MTFLRKEISSLSMFYSSFWNPFSIFLLLLLHCLHNRTFQTKEETLTRNEIKIQTSKKTTRDSNVTTSISQFGFPKETSTFFCYFTTSKHYTLCRKNPQSAWKSLWYRQIHTKSIAKDWFLKKAYPIESSMKAFLRLNTRNTKLNSVNKIFSVLWEYTHSKSYLFDAN